MWFFSLEDYPAGTWLGDESNPEMRVRCPVSPADMLHISTNCRTAEKMALTLLDYLFHREVQAMSNLSGQGKHGKKQLDPLMIYGIRCESVTDKDFLNSLPFKNRNTKNSFMRHATVKIARITQKFQSDFSISVKNECSDAAHLYQSCLNLPICVDLTGCVTRHQLPRQRQPMFFWQLW